MIPKRRGEVRGLFRAGDGQTTGWSNGQSFFHGITEEKRKGK